MWLWAPLFFLHKALAPWCSQRWACTAGTAGHPRAGVAAREGWQARLGAGVGGESRLSSTGDNASQMRLLVTAAGVLSGSLYDCHCAIDAPDETHGVCRGWTWALNLRDPGGTSEGPYLGSSINNLL